MSKKPYAERNLKFETLQLHVGQEQPDPVTGARAVPIYQTSSYVFRNCDHAAARFGLEDSGEIYGRLGNPTQGVFEQRIAALEGGTAALAVASGAAAICYTIQNLAKQGDHIVSANNIYGGTYNLLAHTLVDYGVTTTFVAPSDYDRIEASFRENTKALYIETLGNPNSDVVDIERLAQIAHAHKVPLVVDNTFATPYLVRPFEYGADIVVHSATKFIGGHGTSLGGVIVENGKFDWEGQVPSSVHSEPQLSWCDFHQGSTGRGFCDRYPCHAPSRYGRLHFPCSCFYFLTGTGDTVSARRASCGECTEGSTVSECSSSGRTCASSFRIHRSGAAGIVSEIFPERRRFHLHLRDQGRQGDSEKVL